MSKKILTYPETRQFYNFDCGANALMSMLVFAGIEEREERVAALAGTTKDDGTSTAGIRFTFGYFGQPIDARERMSPTDLRKGIDKGFPTMLSLQAYRDSRSIIPYRDTWIEGHYVVAIGYEGDGLQPDDKIIFEDPASFKRTFLTDGELMERWHDIDTVDGQHTKIIQWGCTLLVPGVFDPNAQERME